MIYNQIKSLYKNIFLWKYTSIFKKVDFYTEYVKCVDYVLNNLVSFQTLKTRLTIILKVYTKIYFLFYMILIK